MAKVNKIKGKQAVELHNATTATVTMYVEEIKPISRQRYCITKGVQIVIVSRYAVVNASSINPKLYKLTARAGIASQLI